MQQEPPRIPQFIAVALTCSLLAACTGIASTSQAGRASVGTAEGAGLSEERLLAKGRSQFLHCNSCHTLDADEAPPVGADFGPHLEGIIGRPAGSIEDFDYIEDLRSTGIVWDEATLDRWLREPEAVHPRICEPFGGISSPLNRRALIAWLAAASR